MSNFYANDKYRKERFYANMFGKLFQFQARYYKLESKSFIRTIMTDKRFEEIIVNHDEFDWCDETFLCSELVNNFNIQFKQGKALDQYMLWYAGYLYKWWMMLYNKKPCEVYRILPITKLIDNFDFYHTQDWDYVIQDATERYNENHKRR